MRVLRLAWLGIPTGNYVAMVSFLQRTMELHVEFEGPSTATWRQVTDAEHELFTFIERYYNQTRLHSHNDYRTPNEAEADLRSVARAA